MIILTGMMGSGKSSLGKHLATLFNYKHIDLDKYIVLNAKSTISSIFANYGEPYFRKIEEQCLEEIIIKYKFDDIILSLGGGTFESSKNRKLCLEWGIVIWLNTDINIIANRLANSSKRPLLQAADNKELLLKNLLKTRVLNYKQAHISIDITKNYSKKTIATFIMNAILNYIDNCTNNKEKI